MRFSYRRSVFFSHSSVTLSIAVCVCVFLANSDAHIRINQQPLQPAILFFSITIHFRHNGISIFIIISLYVDGKWCGRCCCCFESFGLSIFVRLYLSLCVHVMCDECFCPFFSRTNCIESLNLRQRLLSI